MSTPVKESLTEDKHKAIDLLVESIKAILTLSTILISGLLAYIGTVGGGLLCWQNITALSFLFLSCILSIININSLVNKVYRGEVDAVMDSEVKIINVVLSLSLLFGLGFSSWYIFTCLPASNPNNKTNNSHMIIQRDSIEIPDNFSTTIKIEKEAGNIKTVIINEKKEVNE